MDLAGRVEERLLNDFVRRTWSIEKDMYQKDGPESVVRENCRRCQQHDATEEFVACTLNFE